MISSCIDFGTTIRTQRHLEGRPEAWHKRCRITSLLRILTFSTVRRAGRSSCNRPASRTLDQNPVNFVVEINPAMENGTWETTDEHYISGISFGIMYSG